MTRTRETLSDWLEGCVRARVEVDLRSLPSTSPGSSSSASSIAAKRLFALLSGNQISRACDEALDSRFLHLATLISQSPDDIFRGEIKEQLRIWKEERVFEVIDEHVLKLWRVLSGELVMDGIRDKEKLDWRRAFGLRMWWGEHANGSPNGIQDIFNEYEDLLKSGKVPRPIPWWLEHSPSPSSTNDNIQDAHYLLISLASSPDTPLDIFTQSQAFSPIAVDNKLGFFVSLVLGHRGLGVRDFSDRVSCIVYIVKLN